jgi:DNA-binding NarL/FixJ family response regulator
MRFAVEISVVVDGKRHLLGAVPIEFYLRDLKSRKALSRRHQEVLDLVAAGKMNKEIAEHLNITERTVKYHVSLLMGRFGADSRLALVAAYNKQIRSGG